MRVIALEEHFTVPPIWSVGLTLRRSAGAATIRGAWRPSAIGTRWSWRPSLARGGWG